MMMSALQSIQILAMSSPPRSALRPVTRPLVNTDRVMSADRSQLSLPGFARHYQVSFVFCNED